MKNEMITLISPNDDKIKIHYDELEDVCSKVVEENFQKGFVKVSTEDVRTEHDNTFGCISDFVLFNLGYTIKNPLLLPNVYGVYDNQRIYLKKKSQKSTKEFFLSADSRYVRYNSLNQIKNPFSNGFIDQEGTVCSIASLKENFSEHRILARMLLHKYLMKERENTTLFLNYIKENERNENTELMFLTEELNLIPYSPFELEKVEIQDNSYEIVPTKEQEQAYQIVKRRLTS